MANYGKYHIAVRLQLLKQYLTFGRTGFTQLIQKERDTRPATF